MKRLLILLLILCLPLAGCGGEGQRTDTVYAMDTVMELTVCGDGAEAALEAAKAEVYRLDGLFDRRNEDGEIFALNRDGEAAVSEDTRALLLKAAEIRVITDGAFDVTVAPVMDLWGFYDQRYRVPAADEIASALESVGGALEFEGDSVRLGQGVQLDPGGIAKGYTSAKIMDIFREKGVTSGLVSLGGNVQALGLRPDGQPWRVAVQDPDGEGYAGILRLRDMAAVTSGDYQRYFEQDGKKYHHLIDPDTGYPAESGLRSVTVVCADGTMADGLSTALFVMGRDRALELWRRRGDFEAVFIDGEGKLTATAGLEGVFESEREVEFVE